MIDFSANSEQPNTSENTGPGPNTPPGPPSPDPFVGGYSERFVDPTTGRMIAILRWDRQWTMVQTELRSGPLPLVRDLSLFERGGLATTSSDGEIVVRIDRATLTPHFAVSLNGRRLMAATEEQLPPSTIAELAKQGPPPRGTSTQALLAVVAAIVAGVVLVTAGVIWLGRVSSRRSAAQTTVSPFFPAGTLPAFPAPPVISPTIAPSFSLVEDRLAYEARLLGSPDPVAAATCMQTEYPQIANSDVDGPTAMYRSAQYRCMQTEMTSRWRVAATGLLEQDKACANLGSTIGMGKLTLEEMERTMPYSDTAQYPADIQAKLVAAVNAQCPQILPEVAERVITEKFPG